MIWATPYVEHGSTSGGKGGGGGGAATTYTYTQSMAIALGDEPIIGVRRIWANGRVIYDVGSDDPATIIASNAAGRLANGENFTVYRGTETQMPNSRIVAEQAKLQNAYYFYPRTNAVAGNESVGGCWPDYCGWQPSSQPQSSRGDYRRTGFKCTD